jgi:protein-S-isoprenylcysteine O-methyltransferase Ste14
VTLGDFLFRWRGELAIPFVVAAVALAQPLGRTFAAGLAIALAGELIRLSALRHIGPKSRRTSRSGSHAVVRSGPYAWTRNPLYLGNLLLTAGLLVAANRPLLCVAGVLAVFAHYWFIIGAEERALENDFGEDYRRYQAEVPRLLPLPPKARGGPAPFTLGEVILPETNTIVTFELAFFLVGAVGIWRLSG